MCLHLVSYKTNNFEREFEILDPTMSAGEDGGGGYATVGASQRAARLQKRPDYRALHTGKPTGQRRTRATTVSDLPSNSTLDDVIGLLNIIVTQNDRLAERNEELTE